MRDETAIVEVAFDVRRIDAAHIAVRDAETKSKASTKRAKSDRDALNERKIELGLELCAARKSMPARGSKENGWSAFLSERGIPSQRASECIDMYRKTLIPDSPDSGDSIDDYESEDHDDSDSPAIEDDEDDEDVGAKEWGDEIARRRAQQQKPAPDIDRTLAKIQNEICSFAESVSAQSRGLIAHELRETAKRIEEMK